jgi:hypothetical protein
MTSALIIERVSNGYIVRPAAEERGKTIIATTAEELPSLVLDWATIQGETSRQSGERVMPASISILGALEAFLDDWRMFTDQKLCDLARAGQMDPIDVQRILDGRAAAVAVECHD